MALVDGDDIRVAISKGLQREPLSWDHRLWHAWLVTCVPTHFILATDGGYSDT